MTVPFIVIARSEARKQSIFCVFLKDEIATPPLREARNDKKVDLPRLFLGKPRNDEEGDSLGFPLEAIAMKKESLSRLTSREATQ